MKTLFLALFVIIFCFTSIQCDYTPTFTQCKGVVAFSNVTLPDVPVPGQNASMLICGTIKKPFSIHFVKVHVNALPQIDDSVDVDLSASWSTPFCLNFTFAIPKEMPPSLQVYFAIDAEHKKLITCLDVDLDFNIW